MDSHKLLALAFAMWAVAAVMMVTDYVSSSHTSSLYTMPTVRCVLTRFGKGTGRFVGVSKSKSLALVLQQGNSIRTHFESFERLVRSSFLAKGAETSSPRSASNVDVATTLSVPLLRQRSARFLSFSLGRTSCTRKPPVCCLHSHRLCALFFFLFRGGYGLPTGFNP